MAVNSVFTNYNVNLFAIAQYDYLTISYKDVLITMIIVLMSLKYMYVLSSC
jgi:hypothetical protein